MSSYKVYTVEYAKRTAPVSDLFLRAPGVEQVPMSYYFWAIVGSDHTVIVDAGFTEEKAKLRGRELTLGFEDGLKAIDIDPKTVKHVVLSHFHWDHMGNLDCFPEATFYAQMKEMMFWTGPYSSHPAFNEVVEKDDITTAVRLQLEGRLVQLDGAKEILPGITLERVGGHTAGMQVVYVDTEAGRAVVASDAVKTYKNLRENIPDPFLHDIPEMLDAYERIRTIVPDENLILPGHDPDALNRFQKVSEGIVVLG